MKKTLIKVLTLLVSSVLALSACGAKPVQTPTPDAGKETAKESEATPGTDAEAEKIELTIWSQWASDADGMKAPLDTVVANWNAEHPNVQLKLDPMNTESYKTKLKTAAVSKELPDIFFTWGGGFSKPFIEEGIPLDLTPYVTDEIRAKIPEAAFEHFMQDGKVYGMPCYMWAGVLFVNEKIFKDNNLKLPQTWDDLMAAIPVLNEKGITPIEVGEKELWPGIFFQNVLALRMAGSEACVKALSKEASFDTPEMKASAEKLLEMVKAGAFSPNALGVDELEAEANFMQGKAAMLYMGDWAAAGITAEDCPVKNDVIAMNFPSIPGAKNEKGMMGGSIDTFMVNSESAHKEEAVQALMYIAENLGAEGLKKGAALPAWKIDTSSIQLSELNKQIIELVNSADAYMLAWDTFLEGADADQHLNAVAHLISGEGTADEFVQTMQELNA